MSHLTWSVTRIGCRRDELLPRLVPTQWVSDGAGREIQITASGQWRLCHLPAPVSLPRPWEDDPQRVTPQTLQAGFTRDAASCVAFLWVQVNGRCVVTCGVTQSVSRCFLALRHALRSCRCRSIDAASSPAASRHAQRPLINRRGVVAFCCRSRGDDDTAPPSHPVSSRLCSDPPALFS